MGRAGNGFIGKLARAVVIACLPVGGGAARAQDRGQAGDNVRIENVTAAPRDARTTVMRFDIAWDNSWRDKANHDAACVFFKVRADGKAEWQHVRLVLDKVLNPTSYGQEKGGTRLDFIVPDGNDGRVLCMQGSRERSPKTPKSGQESGK
jgi:hypothetical protein